jgi:hypothetical protein
MVKKLSLVIALIAATCFAGLILNGSSTVATANGSTTMSQNNNRDMGRRNSMGRRRHRRHYRRHYRRYNRRQRRGNRNGNM